jgi:hypothetical protein
MSQNTSFYLHEDIRKAAKSEAWMLTFLGILVAVDVMARDYYFNVAFRKENSIEPDVTKINENSESWTWNMTEEQENSWEKLCRGNAGIMFRLFLQEFGALSVDDCKLLWNFRGDLAHEFSLGSLMTSQARNSSGSGIFSVVEIKYGENDIRKDLLKQGTRKILHLPEFYEFYRDKLYQRYPEKGGKEWWDIRGKLWVEREAREGPINVEELVEEHREPFS